MRTTKKQPPYAVVFFAVPPSGFVNPSRFNARGAQVCNANLMSRTKAIVWKEVNIKNKVRAGKEVVANDTLSPPNRG